MTPPELGVALDRVLKNCIDGVFVVDADRKVTFFSEGCERLTGASEPAVRGSACACHELADCRDEHGRSLSGFLCPASKIFAGEIGSYRQRMTIERADGNRAWVETTYSPVTDEDGLVSGVVGVMRDITEVMEREEDLRAAAEAGSRGAGEAEFGGEPRGSEPSNPNAGGVLDRKLTALERREIVEALNQAGGQRTQAAKALGISRSRLYRRLEALGIDPRGAAYRVSP